MSTPNIDRILYALTDGFLKGKWTKEKLETSKDLHEIFSQFLVEEGFDENDEAMEDEFGDDKRDESFFMDWLYDEDDDRKEQEISIKDKEKLDEIWNDLHKAYKNDITFRINNILLTVTENQIKFIEQLILKQCNSLRRDQDHIDKLIMTIIQIGKQNHNHALLMDLADACSRCRIQKLKNMKRAYGFPSVKFTEKWKDITVKEFIKYKCKGLEKLSNKYSKENIDEFKQACIETMDIFFTKGIVWRPPMTKTFNCIDDNIIHITEYIFESYHFIQKFIEDNKKLLPFHIDIVIVPNDIQKVVEEGDDNWYDDWVITDINKRMQNHNVECIKNDVRYHDARKAMKQTADKILGKGEKTHQRAIIIIDRSTRGQDKLYGYQPHNTLNCHSFEPDADKFLAEGLLQNSRDCVIPKLINGPAEQDETHIGIASARGFLCLSFHCYDENRVCVYLNLFGWTTRFFIQDVKYYLPMFYVEGQGQKRIKREFGEGVNPEFVNKYETSKGICIDRRFEEFYAELGINYNCH